MEAEARPWSSTAQCGDSLVAGKKQDASPLPVAFCVRLSVALTAEKVYTEHEDASEEGVKLEVREEVADGVVIFRIIGRFDAEAATNQGLQSAVGSAIDRGAPRIIFDMREVTFVTSAGLRVLIVTAKQAEAAKGGLSIFGVRSLVNEVFEISGLKEFIPIVSDEAEARLKLGA